MLLNYAAILSLAILSLLFLRESTAFVNNNGITLSPRTWQQNPQNFLLNKEKLQISKNFGDKVSHMTYYRRTRRSAKEGEATKSGTDFNLSKFIGSAVLATMLPLQRFLSLSLWVLSLVTASNGSVGFKSVISITMSYFFLYYSFLFKAGASKVVKTVDGEEFDQQLLAWDRAAGNTLEQMGPFLVTLWLHAKYVSSKSATFLGAFYVALRSLYPILRPFFPQKMYLAFFVTTPNYFTIWYMGLSAVISCFRP